ncbi:MAG: hypothetical protein PUC82_04935 [bacterium]|nr:hypothetical protein [bacterium]
MREIVLFFICFVLILTIYEIFIVWPMKKYKASKNKKKGINRKEKSEPAEIKFLVNKYGLDLEKVNYNQLLQIVSLTSSFDMALIVSIIMLVDGYLWQLILAIALVIPVIFISYGLVAKFYKKKGMIRNV